MEQLQVFDFETNEVRTVVVENEPYFVGKDVAMALGYSRPAKAIQDHVEEDDKDVVPIQDSIGRNQNTSIIKEAGVYSLIFGSQLESAKRFKRWVTSEVLPTIRETGKYEVVQDPLEMLDLSLKAIKQSNERIDVVEEKVVYLENEVRLSSSEYHYISKLVSKTIYEAINVFTYANTQKVQAALRKDINGGINQLAGTRTRSQLKQKDFEKVVQFIQSWVPSTATRMEVEQLTLDIESENNIEQ